MHALTTLLPPLLLLLPSLPLTTARQPPNAILLSNVQSLTLRGGQKTTHRRVPAAPQLKCISAKNICDLHTIDIMRCTNQGAAYGAEDIQWSCTASLPPELKLGSTDVICEGYANSDDPYVLKGSCGVEYRLVLTEEGERKLPHLAGGRGWGSDWTKGGSTHGNGEKMGWDTYLFWVFFIVVCVVIFWSACFGEQAANGARPPRRPRRNNWGGGGGGWWPGGGGGGDGGGPGGWTDPPPPYPGTSQPKPSSSSSASSGGWQPGFWSGLAGGAAAGYMAGNRGNSSRSGRDRQAPNYGGGGGWGAGPSSSSGSGWGAGPSNSGPSSSSTSSSRYESTGFGSTSRR